MMIKDLKVGMDIFLNDKLRAGFGYGGIACNKEIEMLSKMKQPQKIIDIDEDKVIIKGEYSDIYLNYLMIDFIKTFKHNIKLVYDRNYLRGKINGIDICIANNKENEDELERSLMLALLQSIGYTCEDIKEIEKMVKIKWIPKISEEYYYIDSYGQADKSVNFGDEFDEKRIKFGNCFKTFEEAEDKAVEIMKVLNI